jgi:hypothetical protein
VPATADFRLSITRALGDQLADAFGGLTPAPLNVDALDLVQSRRGVYQLFLDGGQVYIGKADRSLSDRLGNHRRKISGRNGISLQQMSFTAVYVDEDLSAVAPETLLINRHRGAGLLPWNYNGFGNKDPGRQRDTSRVEAGHFDSLYPANLDFVCASVDPGPHSVRELLTSLKAELPYVFRFETAAAGAAEPEAYRATSVSVADEPPTADSLFRTLAEAMPGWQITALPGYVVMYREDREYPSARKVYRRRGDPS